MSYGYDYETKERFLSDIKAGLFPKLTELDSKRKRVCWIYNYFCTFGGIGLVLLGFGSSCFLGIADELIVLGFIGMPIAIFGMIKSDLFLGKLKEQFSNDVLKHYGNVKKEENPIATEELIDDCAILPWGKYSEHDSFTGELNRQPFSFAEITISKSSGKSSHTVFSGVLIKIPFNNVNGHTIITSQKHEEAEEKLKLYPPVEGLSDIIYTNSDMEAYTLITPKFVEKYNAIKAYLNTEDMRIAFFNNCLFLTYPKEGNLFETFDLKKSLTDIGMYEKFYDDMSQIYKIVEILDIKR